MTALRRCNACDKPRQVKPSVWLSGLIYLCQGCYRAAVKQQTKRRKINVDR